MSQVLPSFLYVFFLMIRRPPRSTLDRSSAASEVYKRQTRYCMGAAWREVKDDRNFDAVLEMVRGVAGLGMELSLIHISEPTRPY